MPVPDGLIAFNSTEGEEMMFSPTTTKKSFMQIFQHLQTQKTQALCGAATGATILNAMRVEAPADPWFFPYNYYTQETFFSSCVQNEISMATVLFQGMTLDELTKAIECWPVSPRKTHAADSTVETFRTAAVDALTQGEHVAVNFLRSAIGEQGGGHWVPLGAYSVAKDMFLLLDVSRYKYPPVWVPANVLFDAMNTVDSTSGLTRGFITVQA